MNLLKKFEVAMKINDHEMLIPALMKDNVPYPKPDVDLSDVENLGNLESFYTPTLHRYWLADYVPAGFWPRMIYRVATDRKIRKVLYC